MTLFSKLQPVLIIAAALVGLALGAVSGFGTFSASLIEPALMVLLFFVFLSVDGRRFKEAFSNRKFTLTATIINFVWTPLFAFALGLVFFGESVDLQMGLVMLLVTPCTDWYLVFTGIAGGNVTLGASILPLNLLLQIVLLPVYLLLFFGSSVQVGVFSLLGSILIVLVIPFAVSSLIKIAGHRAAGVDAFVEKLKSHGDELQLVFLCLAVACMFASESAEVFANPILLVRMFVPLGLFFAVNFLLVRLFGRATGMRPEDVTSLNFTTLARNSPLSLAIAVAALPDRPLIALALVIGPLIELPVLGIIASLLRKHPRVLLSAR